MGETVYSQIVNSALPDKATVFYAGSDQVNVAFRLLRNWLDERHVEFVKIDLEQDQQLSGLLCAETAATLLPILCVDGRIAATRPLLVALLDARQMERLFDHHDTAPTPVIAVTAQAMTILRAAHRSPFEAIRLTISERFEHSLGVDVCRKQDFKLILGDVLVVLDPQSAARANGLAIDWVSNETVSGFRIDNPNEAPRVREVPCGQLAYILAEPTLPLIIDVRTDDEAQAGRLPTSKRLNAELIDALALLERRTPLLFYCDNGRRSRRAAQHYLDLGYVDVTALAGGINAWKLHLAKSGSIS